MATTATFDPDLITGRVENALAQFAFRMVREACGSSTLRRFLRIVYDSRSAAINVPHYWAVYYHDGVPGRIVPRVARLLVWFSDPRDDPRHRGNFPIRLNEANRLLREEFLEGLAQNASRGPGAEPFMRTARSVRGTGPHPFFPRGLRGAFARGGSEVARSAFLEEIRKCIPTDRLTLKVAL